MKKKFVYKPVKTVIRDLGDGKIWVVYIKRPKDKEGTYELAKWAVGISEDIMLKYPNKKSEILIEIGHKGIPLMDHRTRQVYQDNIESDQFGKMALVTSRYIYIVIRIIRSMLLKNSDKVFYCDTRQEALEKLGWSEDVLTR